MVALQIRGVSDEVRDALAARAASRGQSLQAYLLELVELDAQRPGNAEILRRLATRGTGVTMVPGEAAKVLEEVRTERDTRLR